MATEVETIVIITDKATLARAKNATTFDAVPPGQHDTRINPTANMGSISFSLSNLPIPQPKNGMITN